MELCEVCELIGSDGAPAVAIRLLKLAFQVEYIVLSIDRIANLMVNWGARGLSTTPLRPVGPVPGSASLSPLLAFAVAVSDLWSGPRRKAWWLLLLLSWPARGGSAGQHLLQSPFFVTILSEDPGPGTSTLQRSDQSIEVRLKVSLRSTRGMPWGFSGWIARACR